MRALNVMAAAAVAAGLGQGALAQEVEGGAATSPAEGRVSEVVVVGKSYGPDVGKLVAPLKEVPNTVTVIAREQIELQNLFTLEDALTMTSGITVNGVGSEDPSFLSRGFPINNYLVDGTPTLSFGFPAVVPDLFAYERLEVLRGPAGLFSGSGNPAGSINLVRKRPLPMFAANGSVGYGSYDNLRVEADVSAPVAQGVGVRFGAMVQDQDQFFDTAHRNRVGAFGAASVELGSRTTLTFGANYDRFKPAIQSGLPGIIGGADGSRGQLLDIRRSTYLGAHWNRFRSDSWSGFADLEHKLSDRWSLRATALVTDVDRIDVYSYIGSQPITPTSGTTNHIAYRGDSFFKTKAFDVNAIGAFSLFGRDHSLIAGADYQSSDSLQYFTRLSNYARIDVYNPVSPAEPPLNPYGPLPPFVGPNGPVAQVYGASTTDVEQYGTYGQVRLSLVEGVTLVGGGRVTWWETDGQTLLPAVLAPTGYSIEGRFTPYAGLVWDATEALNVYASYADSFTPQSSTLPRLDGGQIEPLLGEQFEVGSKLTLFGDRLLVSAAAFRVTQSNRIYTDPNLPGVVQQIGKVRAQGAELNLQGQILPGWTVNGGYSFTRTKYLEDANPFLEGVSFVPVIPKHAIKLFTNYVFADGALDGASIGGGLTWLSATSGGNTAAFNPDGTLRTRSTIVSQGGYAVVDLRVGYKVSERVSLGVNVNNLLDKTYYSRISATGRGNYYGSPRSVFATLRFNLQ